MLPKVLRITLIGATVAVLVGILLFLYAKTRAVDAEGKVQVESHLRQLKQLDAEWNVDVLKSRMEIHKNYDPLTNPLASLANLQGKLAAQAKIINEPGTEVALNQLKSVFDEKVDLVDQFKSQNAILKNSLRYVPTAINELHALIHANRPASQSKVDNLAALDANASQVLNEVLIYNLLPEASTAAKVQTVLTQIERPDSPYPEILLDPVRNLVNHTRTILRQRVIENELLNKISAVPMTEKIDRLGEVFEKDFQAALARSYQYRNYLLAYSGFLLLLLAYIGSRLFRSYRVIASVNKDLKDANETLENRVQERTEELSKALVDLKESEAQLVQSEKMASLGQMVAGVAHEINTPLAYVRSSLETVEAQLSGIVYEFIDGTTSLLTAMRTDDATEEEITEKFVAAAQLMDRYNEFPVIDDIKGLLNDGVYGVDQIKEIVVNLKDFSRLDRSRVASCKVEDCMESTLQLAKSVIKTKRITKFFAQTPPINCSPSQINQVFLNLITNAAQATEDDNGVITLVTKMHGQDHVAVEVMDNGTGISDEVLPKIFDPFFTTKDVGKGTGLGLTIVYKIVEQHGGEIKIHSKPGIGTKFTVILPVQRSNDDKSDKSEPAEPMAIAA
jgi:signal transduction histidine kinase